MPPVLSRRAGPLANAGALLAVLAGAVGLFYLLFAASIHAYLPDSDSATVVLEANSMLHGHALLSSWAISLDSFWLVDTLWYMAAVAVAGIHPYLMHAVPALIATFVILLGVLMALEERRGASRVVAGGVVIAIIGLPSEAWATFFLRGPWHVGTLLWALVAFYAIRKGRFNWGFVVAVVFLAAGMLGDLQMAALGTGPVFLAGLFAMARRRDWRAGIAQVSAAVGAAVLAEVVRRIARAIGTFSIAPANPHAGLHTMLQNIRHGLHESVLLMGAGSSYYGLGGVPSGLADVRWIAIVVVGLAGIGSLVALLWGAVAGRPTVAGEGSDESYRLDDMLLLGALGAFAAFCFLATSPDPTYARYLIAAVCFGAILAARAVGRLLDVRRLGNLARLGLLLGAGAACCYAAGVGLDLAQPAPVPSTAALASFLESHGLHNGVGAYWSASIVTVESSGQVAVRPVVTAGGRIVRYDRNSAGYWYERPFGFLVYDTALPWGGVSSQSATATFGPPAKTYTVAGIYKVLVWAKPIHVSPHRRSQS